MKFVKRRQPVNIKVGNLVDDNGRQIEVYYDMTEYSCKYKGQKIAGATEQELVDKFLAVAESPRNWIDVLILMTGYSINSSCPPRLDVDMTYVKCHIAQLSDGSWVKASWAPDSVFRHEQKADYPLDMTLPYRKDTCGRTVVVLGYTENLEIEIKQQQLLWQGLASKFVDEVVK